MSPPFNPAAPWAVIRFGGCDRPPSCVIIESGVAQSRIPLRVVTIVRRALVVGELVALSASAQRDVEHRPHA
ncbi:hypothetical protein [Rhodococcus opacus]|uniref:hypothetical protein n=1 Tax=Rhodococcus opacus TaxID=37919 RepID=UPI00105720FD|nr:hypothetical protein [Rhodococcus opacus]